MKQHLWILLLLLLPACKVGSSGGTTSTQTATTPGAVGECTTATVEVVAIDVCEVQCTAGSASACAAAAKKYWGGNGVERSLEACEKLAIRACELSSAEGCALAASVYSGFRDGTDGTFKDAKKEEAFERRALALFERDCEAGNGSACLDVAWWYRAGGPARWLEPDPKRMDSANRRGAQLLQKACDAGGGFECRVLALNYVVGGDGFARDKGRAAKLYVQACDQGDALGCYEAATGGWEELPRNELLRRACERGLTRACETLALYERLDGQPTPTTPAARRTMGPFGDDQIEAAVAAYLRDGTDTTSSGLPLLCAKTRKATTERWTAACARYRAARSR